MVTILNMKKIVTFSFLSLMLFTLFSCTTNRIMQGYVYESYNKSPVANVTIQVDNQNVITNQKGSYSIQVGKTKKVKVLIQDKRFEEFNDWVVIPDKINYRDFILDAAHPLGLKTEDFQIPTAYSYQLRMGTSENSLQFIGTVDSDLIDESMRINGKKYDAKQKVISIQSIKIGLSGFETDELGFWNMFEVPTDFQLKLSSKENYLTKLAYHFFEDTMYTYKMAEKPVMIDNIPCMQFSVTESGSNITTEVFLIQDGPEKGLVKRMIQNDKVNKEYIMITFMAFHVEVPIVPPEIIE